MKIIILTISFFIGVAIFLYLKDKRNESLKVQFKRDIK
jgi:hypothetical protein